MKTQRATLEIIAPTIEEAVEKGLTDLGLPQEAVEVEVLDPGSKGLFGLGSRHAWIRLIVKGGPGVEAPDSTLETAPDGIRVSSPTAAPTSTPRPTLVEAESEETYDRVEPVSATESFPPEESTDEDDAALRAARETVSELLDKMQVKARVSARYGEPDDAKSRIPVLVEIRGDDLAILIGKRAETLNALQYIASLIINKELGHSIALVIDVEGYRSRREGQIRQLARRMADQAVKTGRRQVLEPMPANERRLIHIELRNHPDVTTESIGEEPHRKVTIVPKE